jgi:hypothetical protein
MHMIHACCGGVVVQKKRVVACLMTFDAAGHRQQEMRPAGPSRGPHDRGRARPRRWAHHGRLYPCGDWSAPASTGHRWRTCWKAWWRSWS